MAATDPRAGSDKIAVVLVDDHAIVRQGLRTYLELQSDIEVVGEASDGREAVGVVRDTLPDIVLMDLVMPNSDGVEATRAITGLVPSTRVIVLTSFSEDEKVFASIKAGAQGYLMKDVLPQDLVKAIRTVYRGEAQLDPEIARKLMQEFTNPQPQTPRHDLTERELEVLRLIAHGKTNKDISEELVLSEKTVKTHVSNILQKLHLSDRTQAAVYALRQKIVD
ncbi:MAG: response regulator transcription factor [Chloroflexota bacterium]|nr:response regulator transcription factor [Chloroflexota bacterium]MDQ5864629.1 response regulator transcription factor [Chloroflexota bacterium]